MDTRLITIIVPVYNTAEYLRQCVDSLLGQTYQNVEIILVNDGSTDNSGEICDDYAKQARRVRVIHKENGGASSTRETGISNAQGDYLMIVDSDDWLDKETVEVCMERAQKTGADCVMFSYVKEYGETSIPMHVLDGDQSLEGQVAQDKVYRRLFGLLDDELQNPERMENVVSCCMKLYKTDLARQGKYFDTKVVGSSEDALFNMYALHGAKKIEYLDNPFYHYRKNPKSITNMYRPRLVEQWNTLFDTMGGIIEEKGLDDRHRAALNSRIVLSVVGIGMNELAGKELSGRQRCKNIKAYLRTPRYQVACKSFSLKQLPFVWKVFIWCCKHRLVWGTYCLLKAMKILKKTKRG